MTEGLDLHPPPEIVLTEYDRELVKRAGFGMDIERFIESDVGQYLFGLANEMEMACDEQLRVVDPTNLKAIVDLQVRARAAGYLKAWLTEAVTRGIEAVKEAEAPTE